VEELIHLMDDRKEVGQGLNTPSICPQWPARSHLLKFPEPPKIAPPTGDQAFNTQACRGHFKFKLQHNQTLEWSSNSDSPSKNVIGRCCHQRELGWPQEITQRLGFTPFMNLHLFFFGERLFSLLNPWADKWSPESIPKDYKRSHH
jgi:hypothetical protein